MNALEVKALTSIEPYSGPHAIEGIRFRAIRAAIGVSSWGMNVLELDPGCEGHPKHDHKADGQEEVYLVLEGQVELQTDDQAYTLRQGDLVRVPAEVTRQLITRQVGAVILALGGTPGEVYKSNLG